MIPKPYEISVVVRVNYRNEEQPFDWKYARLSIPVDVETKYGIQLSYDDQNRISNFLEGTLKKTIDKYQKDLEEEAIKNRSDVITNPDEITLK